MGGETLKVCFDPEGKKRPTVFKSLRLADLRQRPQAR
jgi:hypothetical protein